MPRAWLAIAAGILTACSFERSETTTETDEAVSVTEQRSEAAGVSAASRLECPEQQGRLRRVAAGADGRRCQYQAGGGAEVELRLAEPSEMEALQAELAALPPGSAEPGPKLQAVSAAYDEAVAKYEAAIEAYDRATEAYDDLRPGASGAMPLLPPIPPVPPVATAPDISGGGTIRAIYYGADDLPGGWRSVGYHLRGPAEGRRVLGLLRSRSGGENRALMRDVEALVDRNMRG